MSHHREPSRHTSEEDDSLEYSTDNSCHSENCLLEEVGDGGALVKISKQQLVSKIDYFGEMPCTPAGRKRKINLSSDSDDEEDSSDSDENKTRGRKNPRRDGGEINNNEFESLINLIENIASKFGLEDDLSQPLPFSMEQSEGLQIPAAQLTLFDRVASHHTQQSADQSTAGPMPTVLRPGIKAAINSAIENIQAELSSWVRQEADEQKLIDHLREQCIREKQKMREKSHENQLRLGRYDAAQKVWRKGSAFEKLHRRAELLKAEKQELYHQAKQLMKKLSEKSSLNRFNSNSSIDSTGEDDNDDNSAVSISASSVGKYIAEKNSLKQILKKALNLREAFRNVPLETGILDREFRMHRSELNRIRYEDESSFNNQRLLNNRYLLLMVLGKGGFSTVFSAFDLRERKFVACKIHQPLESWSEERKVRYITLAQKEYEIHKDLSHSSVVKMYDACEIDDGSFLSVLEYCGGKDLSLHLWEHIALPEEEAKSIIIQVVSALKYLNQVRPPVIHCDLKAGNILLTVSGDIKVADFGMAMNYNPDMGFILTQIRGGTRRYMAPECLCTGNTFVKVSSKRDVWSVGVIFFECIYGVKPYQETQTLLAHGKSNTEATELEFPYTPRLSNEAKEFIRNCLTFKQEERMDVFAMAAQMYIQPPTLNEEKAQSLNRQQQ